MNRKLLALGFFLFLFFSAYSETAATSAFIVKGLVMDSVSNVSIPYTTISVSSAERPEIYVKRVAAGAAGNFELTLNKAGNYLLSFESIGMKKLVRSISISPDEKKFDLGKINMSTSDQKLSGVTVLASKPLVKVDLDKISYDTKSDPESQSTNVLEMLKKVPMVTVDGEDNIQVKGSSNFKVYINGKPSNMTATNPSQVLKSMPASSIKNIEVITEPGAKYEADGVGGIINIVTEKAMAGYTGTLQGSVDSRGGYNGGIYFSTKTGKLGLTANLNYNDHLDPGRISNMYRENTTPINGQKYLNQNSSSNNQYRFYYGNLEASYEIDSLNLISLTMGGHNGGSTGKGNSTSVNTNNQRDTLTAYNQYTETSGTWGGEELSLDYQRSFKKPDQLLTFSYKLGNTPNNTNNRSVVTGLVNYAGSDQKIASDAQGNEHTFQLDYTEPFNKIHVMELGAKYILRINTSDNLYQTYNDTISKWVDTPGRNTNDMNNTQHILGMYGSYTLKLDKFSIKGGLRYEHTNSILTFDQDPTRNFSAPFDNLVPSLSASYKLTMTSNLRLSYNQRINRPGIWYLNPFYDNTNPQSVTQGNPNLKAEIDNSFSLNYGNFSPKLNLNANLYTSFTDRSIESISKLLSSGVVYTTYDNVGFVSNTGLNMYASWQMNKVVRLNGNGSVNYSKFKANNGTGLENSGVRYTFSGGAQLNLPWEMKMNLNGGYFSSGVSLQGTNPSFHYTSLSLGRDFLAKKLNVSIRMQDPFEGTKKLKFTTQTDLYHQQTDMIMKGRYFGVTASYRFGEMKAQIKKVQRGINNDDVKSGGGQSSGGGQ
ncbi:MAG: TonB-dependent receptor [Bacteroidota bacterium]|nr:TonB-dependent receptor [Bacteroidota bacterium]